MRTLMAGLAVLVALGAGCADQTTGQADDPGSLATIAGPPSPPPPRPTEPFGLVATGETMRIKPLTFRLPDKFTGEKNPGGLAAGGYYDGDQINVSYFPALGPVGDLGDQARSARRHSMIQGEIRRLPNVTVDGVEMYRLFGPFGCCGITMTEIGAEVRGQLVTLAFTMETTGRRRDRIIESVLDTVHWRD